MPNLFYDLPHELQQYICVLARPLRFIRAELTKKVEERWWTKLGLFRFKNIILDLDGEPFVGYLSMSSTTLGVMVEEVVACQIFEENFEGWEEGLEDMSIYEQANGLYLLDNYECLFIE